MKTLVLCVLALAACEGGSSTPDLAVPPIFIAEQSDFAKYMTWEKHDLGPASDLGLAGHPGGDEYGYRNEDGAHGVYPIGSMIVKEIHITDIEDQWELFGMAKRGGGYNAGGALDWEYFTFKLEMLDGAYLPVIATRGSNPADSNSSGHGYGQAENGVTCNRCHGIPGTEATDHTLSGILAPL